MDAKKLQLESDKLNQQYAEEIKKVHIEAYNFHKKAIKEFDETCQKKFDDVSKKHSQNLLQFREELEQSKKDFASRIEEESDILLKGFINKISRVNQSRPYEPDILEDANADILLAQKPKKQRVNKK